MEVTGSENSVIAVRNLGTMESCWFVVDEVVEDRREGALLAGVFPNPVLYRLPGRCNKSCIQT